MDHRSSSGGFARERAERQKLLLEKKRRQKEVFEREQCVSGRLRQVGTEDARKRQAKQQKEKG